MVSAVHDLLRHLDREGFAARRVRWALTTIERMRQFLGQWRKLVADGSEWEVELARRGLLDELALEIAWVEEHAVAIVES